MAQESTISKRPQPTGSGSSSTPVLPGPKRQYVGFGFYKMEPAWRRLPAAEREQGKKEFVTVVEDYRSQGMIVLAYSLVGMRGDCDFLLWRITERLEALQEMSTALMKTGLGKWLGTPYSYLAMTKRSIYIQTHEHMPALAKSKDSPVESRERIIPGQKKYTFIYPFVKTTEWYLLPFEERQRIMNEHFKIGHRYPSVKVNTTYSFGLDDQEFVLAFETDSPADFLDLVMELRESVARKYTLRDTPIFTCIRGELTVVLNTLG